jgi:hypothetical protein
MMSDKIPHGMSCNWDAKADVSAFVYVLKWIRKCHIITKGQMWYLVGGVQNLRRQLAAALARESELREAKEQSELEYGSLLDILKDIAYEGTMAAGNRSADVRAALDNIAHRASVAAENPPIGAELHDELKLKRRALEEALPRLQEIGQSLDDMKQHVTELSSAKEQAEAACAEYQEAIGLIVTATTQTNVMVDGESRFVPESHLRRVRSMLEALIHANNPGASISELRLAKETAKVLAESYLEHHHKLGELPMIDVPYVLVRAEEEATRRLQQEEGEKKG